MNATLVLYLLGVCSGITLTVVVLFSLDLWDDHRRADGWSGTVSPAHPRGVEPGPYEDD